MANPNGMVLRREQWSAWIDPTAAGANAWFVMPELPLDLPALAREALLDQAARLGLRTAAIFYGAIPWKMRNHFPMGLAIAHHQYMRLLNRFDLVFPISEYSRRDLLAVLAESLETQQAVDQKIIAIALPGELPETPRTEEQRKYSARDVLSIFSVCSLEPRKNIGTLLDAFTSARQRTRQSLELTIVGRFIPRTSDGVRNAIIATPRCNVDRECRRCGTSSALRGCRFYGFSFDRGGVRTAYPGEPLEGEALHLCGFRRDGGSCRGGRMPYGRCARYTATGGCHRTPCPRRRSTRESGARSVDCGPYAPGSWPVAMTADGWTAICLAGIRRSPVRQIPPWPLPRSDR